METFITICLIIAGVVGLVIGCMFLSGDYDFDEIDNFWDWLIYSLLWIVQPVKALIKFVGNTFTI